MRKADIAVRNQSKQISNFSSCPSRNLKMENSSSRLSPLWFVRINKMYTTWWPAVIMKTIIWKYLCKKSTFLIITIRLINSFQPVLIFQCMCWENGTSKMAPSKSNDVNYCIARREMCLSVFNDINNIIQRVWSLIVYLIVVIPYVLEVHIMILHSIEGPQKKCSKFLHTWCINGTLAASYQHYTIHQENILQHI